MGGNYGQTSSADWITAVESINSFGRIVASGGSSLGGTLSLVTTNLSEPVGTTIAPLTSSSRTGTFSNITGTAKGANSLVIQYTHYDFTLTVAGTEIAANPNSGSPDAPFTVTGSGFSPGETVSLHLGTKALTSAVADSDGNISQTEKVPSLVAGNYTVTATGKSSFVKVSTAFSIT